MEKRPAVYIRTNIRNAVLYVGVTSNLEERDWYHRHSQTNSFVKRYKLNKLVWYCEYPSMAEAIDGEKKLKAGSRADKLKRIEEMNPQWLDLSVGWHKP